MVIYLEKDIIYTAGIEGDCMYFIASGTVTLITFSGKEVIKNIYIEKKINLCFFSIILNSEIFFRYVIFMIMIILAKLA